MSLPCGIGETVILRGEDAGSRNGSENEKVENKNELVDDGHARHGFGAKASHHNIVQKIYEIGDAHLDHNGQRNGENAAVKRPISDK